MEPDSPGDTGEGSCADYPRHRQIGFSTSLATWELMWALGSED